MLTGKQLRQYLAYKVLDRESEPERKPPVKANRATARRGPERNPAYLAWIRTLPCVACQREGRSEAAHVGTGGGMSQEKRSVEPGGAPRLSLNGGTTIS
jgi:hypothetical protein